MKYYLTMDGGGTKLNALLYDENFRLVARGRGGGVNTTQNTEEAAEKSLRDALSPIPSEIREIEAVNAVFVGEEKMLRRVLGERFSVGSFTLLGEAQAGLLAAGKRSGLLAISGTGSDVFRILPTGNYLCVGGWGPILGDQGSGAWIGQQAFLRAVQALDGWGTPTVLSKMITEKYGVTEKPFDLVNVVYPDPAPFTIMASATRLVSEAAFSGDRVALDILREAGELLGLQMNALLRKYPEPEENTVYLCGGAWKTHPLLSEAFEEALRKEHPAMRVCFPWFEHVLAGAMKHAFEAGYDEEAARALLEKNFPEEIYRKGWEL